MKALVLLLVLVLPSLAYSQEADTLNGWYIGTIHFENVVTDSIVWYTVSVDSLNLGKEDCEHDWVYSDTWMYKGFGCLVDHHGFHCDWQDLMRNRICKKCLRKETQREQWYQHALVFPKSEYDILNERLNKNEEYPLPITIERADTTGYKITMGLLSLGDSLVYNSISDSLFIESGKLDVLKMQDLTKQRKHWWQIWK